MKFFSKRNSLKVLEEINKKTIVKRYINFTIGCLLVALAYNLFLASNDIVAGGIGGIAIILNELTGINNSLVILFFDVLLLILSYFLLGKEKTEASILGSILFPVFVELTSHINVYINLDTSQLLLSSVFGGVMYGFGIGMILMHFGVTLNDLGNLTTIGLRMLFYF